MDKMLKKPLKSELDYAAMLVEIDNVIRLRELDMLKEQSFVFNSPLHKQLRSRQSYNRSMLAFFTLVMLPNNLYFRRMLLCKRWQ